MVLYLRGPCLLAISACGEAVRSWLECAASHYFLSRSSYIFLTPRRTTSALVICIFSLHISSLSTVSLSKRILMSMSFGLSVGRPIFFRPSYTPLLRSQNYSTLCDRKSQYVFVVGICKVRGMQFCRGRRQESGPPPGRPAFCVRQFYRSVPSRISRTRSTPPSTENRTSSPAKPKP